MRETEREGVTTITLPQEATVPLQDRPLTHTGSAFPHGPFGPINPRDAIGPVFTEYKRSIRQPSAQPSALQLAPKLAHTLRMHDFYMVTGAKQGHVLFGQAH